MAEIIDIKALNTNLVRDKRLLNYGNNCRMKRESYGKYINNTNV